MDLSLLVDVGRECGQQVGTPERVDYRVLIPTFMLPENRRGFEIGFLIILPCLVIGMKLPPTSIFLPFKILFFVLVGCWNLLVGSLVGSVQLTDQPILLSVVTKALDKFAVLQVAICRSCGYSSRGLYAAGFHLHSILQACAF